ncbi:hypothetical protein D3C78_740890 [compost metagenome]
MAQQVVQVQVVLPQALGVHLRHRRQGFAEHQVLFIGQRRQGFDFSPGIGQAHGVFEKLEQQPTALAFAQTIGQQQRRGQALGGQQPRTLQLTLKMPGSTAADQQFGQYRLAAPDPGANITLARQHPQQAEQLQLGTAGGVGQADVQGQIRAAPGILEFRQTHQRASFSRRRRVRRCSQVSTSGLSVGWSR